MDSTYNYTATREEGRTSSTINQDRDSKESRTHGDMHAFRRITENDMSIIMPYLDLAPGRTTDFSYGGILMWVDLYKYEYCIFNDTLFIKGVLEDDLSQTAFSLPLGKMNTEESIRFLADYCGKMGIRLKLSAIPEEAVDEIMALNPASVQEIPDMGDYLYDAETLATLQGKKMSKKRNHVNRFLAENDDWSLEHITADNVDDVMRFMNSLEADADISESARTERELTRRMLAVIARGNTLMEGYMLRTGEKICAFSIGDVKRDTLFVHIEKASRDIDGSYEMINKCYVERMISLHPEIKFVNREDDAGEIGLRMAKESYHPLKILAKYNIIF